MLRLLRARSQGHHEGADLQGVHGDLEAISDAIDGMRIESNRGCCSRGRCVPLHAIDLRKSLVRGKLGLHDGADGVAREEVAEVHSNRLRPGRILTRSKHMAQTKQNLTILKV